MNSQISCSRLVYQISTALLVVSSVLNFNISPTVAKVSSIVKGKNKTVVKVTGKKVSDPRARVFVWVRTKSSKPPKKSDYEFSGLSLQVDNNGNGQTSGENENLLDELKKGAEVKSSTNRLEVDLNNPSGTVAQIAPNLEDMLIAGLNRLPDFVLAQSVTDGISTLTETWDSGTLYSINLLPEQASWVDLGVNLITEGDLQMEIVEFGSQEILLRVLDDPTLVTSDNAIISGLGVDILPGVDELSIDLGRLGSYTAFLDGNFLETANSTEFVSHEWVRAELKNVPESSSALGLLALGTLGIASTVKRKLNSYSSHED